MMKKLINILMLPTALAVMVACDPLEDRDAMPGSMAKQDLVYSVTQEPSNTNLIYLRSNTPGVIPYWDYSVGTSAQASDTIFIPFEGDYWIKYYAYNGGIPAVDSTKVTLSQNLEYFSDPRWTQLTKQTEGKTWVLDMKHPLAYYGVDFGKGGKEDWTWEPELADNSWIMENKDWGSMTFNLDRGYNYSRTMYDKDGNPVTCNGTFSFDLAANEIRLNGCEMLYGGNFYEVVSTWQKLRVFVVSDTELRLGVLRDQSNEGLAYLVFRFKPQ